MEKAFLLRPDITSLIALHAADRINPEQLKILNAWANESPENMAIFVKYTDKEYMAEELKKARKNWANPGKEWKKVIAMRRRRKIISFLKSFIFMGD